MLGTCEPTFNMSSSGIAPDGDEARPVCTPDFTDMSPLSRGKVVFSTMEGRPGKESNALKRFTTATEIRVQLTRLNTFGDERYQRDESLQSYYYAISDMEIGGHCLCNGHASECIPENFTESVDNTHNVTVVAGPRREQRLRCRCQHNTTGRNCERCADFYNDAPWREATASSAHECRRCECNGHATRCEFDYALYEQTGSGGRCLDCTGNTEGQHCERCKRGFYRAANGECVACYCDLIGSLSEQCSSGGQCLCKPGVEGTRCQRCAADHYDFGVGGCKTCGCSRAGSFNNTPACHPDNGQCGCKQNVGGQRCDGCRLGFFDLQPDHEFGCLPCFCFGHSAECFSSSWYAPNVVESSFLQDADRWTALLRPDNAGSSSWQNAYVLAAGSVAGSLTTGGRSIPLQHNVAEELVYVRGAPGEQAYFAAGDQFNGDQRFAYNQWLRFELRIDEEPPRAGMEDVIIESGSGLSISQPIFGQNNPLPSLRAQQFAFRIHENVEFGWMPTLTPAQFLALLSNVTSLRIRASYTANGGGFLHSVRLESATSAGAVDVGGGAHWVERCNCPAGDVGQFCEECEPGYRHEPRYGGPSAACVPCQCNGHADYCDADSGVCACRNFTAGASCDRCASGYYGDALNGEADACKPCPCPNGGACLQLPAGEVACLHCSPGYGGLRCEQCVDGFYTAKAAGNTSTNSLVNGGSVSDTTAAMATVNVGAVCLPCECNDNVDANALGNCDSNTGVCSKCVYNTYGAHCEKCLQGYYGNPLSPAKGDCRPCECHVQGTIQSAYQVSGRNYETALLCDQLTGQCNCKPYVWGRQCDQCMPDYFNISHPEGCQSCDCDPIGSVGRSCDQLNGQCECKPGVGGLKCDQCLPFHYGFSLKGCSPCNCDQLGSLSPSCDANGQCPCRPHVEGRHCERCRENRHSLASGCAECPTCYRLVQEQVVAQRRRIGELQELLAQIERHPLSSTSNTNSDGGLFERQLATVASVVSELAVDTKNGVGKRAGLAEQFTQLRNRMDSLLGEQQARMFMPSLTEQVQRVKANISVAEEFLIRSGKLLADARRLLDEDGRRALQEASERAYGNRGPVSTEPMRLTEYAREARLLSEKHTQNATELVSIVDKVVDTSTSAEQMAKAALKVQTDNQAAVEQLRAQFVQAHDTLEKTRRMAGESRAHATRAYNASLDLRAKAGSLVVPGLEQLTSASRSTSTVASAAEHRAAAHRIVNGANDLQGQLQSVLAAHHEALNQSGSQLSDARQLLAEANEQQQVLSQLQLTANLSLASARAAVNDSQHLLEHAQNSLRTLNDFHAQLADSKIQAEASLQRLPAIREKVQQVEQKQAEVDEDLIEERRLVEEAREVALGAANGGENSAATASAMVERAKQSRSDAEQIRKSVNAMADKVEETAKDIEESEKQTEHDSDLAREALEKANQAKTRANATSKKINDTITLLERILVDLGEFEINKKILHQFDKSAGFRFAFNLDNLDEFDSARFKELDVKLKLAEEEIIRADIDSRIAIIRQAREHQKNWLLSYEKEIARLTKDVENVNQIRLAIPERCFRDVVLEP